MRLPSILLIAVTVYIWTTAHSTPSLSITLPQNISKIHINIGPNLTPIRPPPDDINVAVLAIEANTGIAHYLREEFQKKLYPHRFFVLSCAIGASSAAGAVSTFHYYNSNGQSSSLSTARHSSSGSGPTWADHARFDPSDVYGPGPAGADLVAVLNLETVLAAIPRNVSIDLLKTDLQGHDLAAVRSALPRSLRRIERIETETYLPGIAEVRYEGVRNDLSEWIPYMKSIGFRLTNPPPRGRKGEYDALWVRVVLTLLAKLQKLARPTGEGGYHEQTRLLVLTRPVRDEESANGYVMIKIHGEPLLK